MLRRHDQEKAKPANGTYIGDTEQGEKEGRQDDEEREELTVSVQQLKLVDEPGDHRLHTAHLHTEHRVGLQAGPRSTCHPGDAHPEKDMEQGACGCPGCRTPGSEDSGW